MALSSDVLFSVVAIPFQQMFIAFSGSSSTGIMNCLPDGSKSHTIKLYVVFSLSSNPPVIHSSLPQRFTSWSTYDINWLAVA
eukprot:1778138-Ditylum_brightwellii.AAC.1